MTLFIRCCMTPFYIRVIMKKYTSDDIKER